MTALDLALFGLATWRIASLLVEEEGPFGVFAILRSLAGVEYFDNGDAVPPIEQSLFAGALSCVWCMSFWVGLAFVILLQIAPVAASWIAAPFAISAIAVTLEKIHG